jgi:hypothetical protein
MNAPTPHHRALEAYQKCGAQYHQTHRHLPDCPSATPSVSEPADNFHDAPEALRRTDEVRDPKPSTHPTRMESDE